MTNTRRSIPAAVLVAAAIALLPPAYVLSLGPAIWLHHHGYLSDSARIVYEPLNWLHNHCKPIGDALEWYARLWQ